MALPPALRRFSYVAIALAAIGSAPPVQARAKAVAVLADGLGFPFPRPFAPDVERREVTLAGVTGDIYGSDDEWPAIVLVPGAAPAGKDDDRIVRLAWALARAERTVFVPQLALADKRFETSDIDGLVAVALALDAAHPGGVTMFGFSYGGSFALLAAADERLEGHLRQVATFGAYFDLVGVAQAVTSGVSLVDGNRVPWDAHPQAESVFREVIVQLAPRPVRGDLAAALAGTISPGTLSPGAAAMYRFAVNRNPERTFDLAERLPDEMRATLTAFSPASVADRIEVDVIAIHSTDDPVVPYGELLRLTAALPDARAESVSLFSHVDLGGGAPAALAGDMLAAWRFAGRLLAAQE